VNPNEFSQRKESADAEDQDGDAFAAVGRQFAMDTCCEQEHGERIIDRELDKIAKSER
jgi:hypothetical protein